MDKNKIKLVIDLGLVISFLAVFVTGFIKLPLLFQLFRIKYKYIAGFDLNPIHNLGGVIMGILVLAHLVLNWKWIVVMLKKYLGAPQ